MPLLLVIIIVVRISKSFSKRTDFYFKGVFTPFLFGSIESNSSSLSIQYSNRTRVRIKQPDRDPAEEVVSVRFQTNSGSVE